MHQWPISSTFFKAHLNLDPSIWTVLLLPHLPDIVFLWKTVSRGGHGKVKKNTSEVVTGSGLQAASKGTVSDHFIPVKFQNTIVCMICPHQKVQQIYTW